MLKPITIGGVGAGADDKVMDLEIRHSDIAAGFRTVRGPITPSASSQAIVLVARSIVRSALMFTPAGPVTFASPESETGVNAQPDNGKKG